MVHPKSPNEECAKTMSSASHTPKPTSPNPVQHYQRGGKRPVQEASEAAKKKLKYFNQLKLTVLLPNKTSVEVELDFAVIKSMEAVLDLARTARPRKNKTSLLREVVWDAELKLETFNGDELDFSSLTAIARTKSSDRVLLIDGHPDTVHNDENLWNVTPKPEMLASLPQGYTIVTALADQVDNALQAVWGNLREKGERRVVSVQLGRDNITITDTGQGMDSSEENCIANWGTVGGSTHRDVHHKGVGGKPPYLKPYLGKYGAGGVAAALHLGGCVTVYSKTKVSKKVVSLQLERQSLVQKHKGNREQGVWRTYGEFRDMTKEEQELAPHGSFTKVQITKLNPQHGLKDEQYWKINTVMHLLKDIYFPYIQSDNQDSKTVTPVTFMVNGKDLVEVVDCDIAVANKHTCNGEPFVFFLRLQKASHGINSSARPTNEATDQANARITCQYYPNERGKEALDTVLEEMSKLKPAGELSQTFETLHRVVIRWLGRLLPESKWGSFPFMEVNLKKEKILGVKQKWAKRVRAYVDLDAGFQPNQSKTELDRDHPFTVALRNMGSADLAGTSAAGVTVNVKQREGDPSGMSPGQLTESYMKWLSKMHRDHDTEFTFLENATYVFENPIREELGTTKAVILFFKRMKDSSGIWEIHDSDPIRIRLQKGAHGLKSDLYGTLEYFFHELCDDGEEDVRVLYRSIDVHEADGCKLTKIDDQNYCFDIRKSQWFPAGLLNSLKCQRLDETVWKKKVEEYSNKSAGELEILTEDEIKKLELQEVFPRSGSRFEAGFTLPSEVVVVARPKKGSGPSHKQGMIVVEPLNMKLVVSHCKCTGGVCRKRRVSSVVSGASSHGHDQHRKLVCKMTPRSIVSKAGGTAVKGLYAFDISSSAASQLVLQGMYTFEFSLEGEKYKDVPPLLCAIHIVASGVTSKWTVDYGSETVKLVDGDKKPILCVRLQEKLEEDVLIQKYDQYNNLQSFEKAMELKVEIVTLFGETLGMTSNAVAEVVKHPEGQQGLQIKKLLFKTGRLEAIEPMFEALLRVYVSEDQYGEMRCKVLPGALTTVEVRESKPLICKDGSLKEDLQPQDIIKILTLQGLDACGNKIDKSQKMNVLLDGLEFQDDFRNEREVDENGCLQLGGLLKVICHYNSCGSLEIISVNKLKLLWITFKTVPRKLVVAQAPPKSYIGRTLEDIIVKIVDAKGEVDTGVDGHNHSVIVAWQKGVTCPFNKGRCVLPPVKLPGQPGLWTGQVYLSSNRKLSVLIEVELDLAIGCTLGPATGNCENLSAECGCIFMFPFAVLDDHGQPGILTEPMKNSIEVKAEAMDSGRDCFMRACTVRCSEIRMSKTPSFSGYDAYIELSGPVGSYMVSLTNTSDNLKGQVQYLCNLRPGKVSQLIVAATTSDSTLQCSSFVPLEVTRCDSYFPTITTTLLDSEDNICTSYEGRTLSMEARNGSEWKVNATKVHQGAGTFASFCLTVPVGNYEVVIQLDPSDDQPDPLRFEFPVVVKHGNYASALTFLESETIQISLSGKEIQSLPRMMVALEAADGKKPKQIPRVYMRILTNETRDERTKEERPYPGSHVTWCETDLPLSPKGDCCVEDAQNVDTLKYEFTDVDCPTQAGVYVMEFFLTGTNVTPISRLLEVRHGPPYKLNIVRRTAGQELDILQVDLLDVFGNKCHQVSGVNICLDLSLSEKFTSKDAESIACVVESNSTTTINEGEGDFGAFSISDGLPGMYLLRVFPSEDSGHFGLEAAVVTVFVAAGNPSETVQQKMAESANFVENLSSYLKTTQDAEKQIQFRKKERHSIAEELRKLGEELNRLKDHEHELRSQQLEFGDDDLLAAELEQCTRNEEDVVNNLRTLARHGNSAALTVWQAQQGGNFLSPHTGSPMSQDVLGVVVMLARVESEALNRILSEYLGVSSLLLVVTKTQNGVSALQKQDRHGHVDNSHGLAGFARSRKMSIPNRFEVLVLADIRPYRAPHGGPPVEVHDSQKVLRIEPPRLPSGEVPSGFLGYAVNLLHLREEQLRVSVSTRHQSESAGLRESLFYNLLGQLQVYQTRDQMIFAKESLRGGISGGAVSLDGGLIRRNQRQQLGRRSDTPPISFPTVPEQERLKTSLLPPACYAFQRRWNYRIVREDISKIEATMEEKHRDLLEVLKLVQDLETNVVAVKSVIKDMANKNTHLSDLVKQLSNAAAIISSNTNDHESSSQGLRVKQMRAFILT